MKRVRPKVLKSTTYKMQTGCGSLFVTISYYDDGPAEIFLNKGHCGGCIYSLTSMIARLSSIALRSGVSLEEIRKQFKDQTCPKSINIKPVIMSCGDAIATAITKFIDEIKFVKIKEKYNVHGLGELQRYCPKCDKKIGECTCIPCTPTKPEPEKLEAQDVSRLPTDGKKE